MCRALDAAFGFGVKEGNSSNFAGSGVEVMKSPYLGKNGHIAVKTNSIPRAAAELAKNGFTLDESTAKYKGEKMVAVYLKQEFGGFAVPPAAEVREERTMKFLTFGEIMLRLKAPGQERFFQIPDARGHLRRRRGERCRLPCQLRRWTQLS